MNIHLMPKEIEIKMMRAYANFLELLIDCDEPFGVAVNSFEPFGILGNKDSNTFMKYLQTKGYSVLHIVNAANENNAAELTSHLFIAQLGMTLTRKQVISEEYDFEERLTDRK